MHTSTAPSAAARPDSQIADDADAAADHLEAHGWMQGDYWQGYAVGGGLTGDNSSYTGGPTCALGALRLTGTGNYDETVRAVTDMTGHPVLHVWNDDQDRTPGEVIQALRDTAIKHRPDAMTSKGDA